MTIPSSPSVDLHREAIEPAMPRPAQTTNTPEYEERWNAWLARGTRHELVLRRRWRIVGGAIVITGGAVAGAFGLWRGAL